MRLPKYIIFNTDWTRKTLAYSSKNLKAATNRDFADASVVPPDILRENFVLPIAQTPCPKTLENEGAGKASVAVFGDASEPGTLSAAIAWRMPAE